MEWNAYHFTGKHLRDGGSVPTIGKTLYHRGSLVLCCEGLHFSRHPFDALGYAPGPLLHRVHVGGQLIEPKGQDKGVCSERTIVSTIDATDLMRKFARLCALDVVHLWDAPKVVLEYLKTGDESIRKAARAASCDVEWTSACVAARAASSAAARVSARVSAWEAARAAAWAAVWAAASEAAWDAAWEAQRVRFNTMVDEEFARKEKTHD